MTGTFFGKCHIAWCNVALMGAKKGAFVPSELGVAAEAFSLERGSELFCGCGSEGCSASTVAQLANPNQGAGCQTGCG